MIILRRPLRARCPLTIASACEYVSASNSASRFCSGSRQACWRPASAALTPASLFCAACVPAFLSWVSVLLVAWWADCSSIVQFSVVVQAPWLAGLWPTAGVFHRTQCWIVFASSYSYVLDCLVRYLPQQGSLKRYFFSSFSSAGVGRSAIDRPCSVLPLLQGGLAKRDMISSLSSWSRIWAWRQRSWQSSSKLVCSLHLLPTSYSSASSFCLSTLRCQNLSMIRSLVHTAWCGVVMSFASI